MRQEKRNHNRFNLMAIVFSFVVVALGLGLYEARTGISDYIPTIKQLQQALIDTGNPRYDVGPRGADGDPGTDTLAGWRNYSIDAEYGIPCVEEALGGTK